MDWFLLERRAHVVLGRFSYGWHVSGEVNCGVEKNIGRLFLLL
jgi:hypothetical protein